MPFTFQGKNIQDLYKSGLISVIPNNILSTVKRPVYDFEKNYPNGIKINDKDINEQAVSHYIEYNSGDNVYTNNVGYKHISLYGRTTTGPTGSPGDDCNSDLRDRGGGPGGYGGPPVDFCIQKIPIGTSNIRINFANDNTKQEVSIGNTIILTGNRGGIGGKGNSIGKILVAAGPAKQCKDENANRGNTGARGNVTCNVGSYNTGLTPVYIENKTDLSHYSVPSDMGVSEKYIRLYLHYQPN